MSKHIIREDYILNYMIYDDVLNNRDIDPYSDSKFRPIRNMSSKRKGRFFEQLTEEYVDHLGWKVSKPENTEHDTIINGKKVEIKGSFLWVTDGKLTHYRWQQIRPSHDYEYIVFLAVDPRKCEFYCSTKQEVSDFVTIQDSNGNYPYNQHGGMTMNSGTYRIDGFPKDFPFMKSIDQLAS